MPQLKADTEAYDPFEDRPLVFKSASGVELTDIYDRRFVDLVNGDGQILLGHAFPDVVEPVIGSLKKRGALNTGPSMDVFSIIDIFNKYVGENLSYSFFSSGSEAVLGVAHSYCERSSRDIILTSGHHGWPSMWRPSGKILEPNAGGVVDFFFQLDLLEDCLKRYGDRIGLICISPDHIWFDMNYYADLFALLDGTDAVICVDDSLQGFRWSMGSSLGKWSESIDVYVFGKCISNGARLSVIAARPGRLPLLEGVNSTSAYEASATASALATLSCLELHPVHVTIRNRGDVYLRGLRDLIEACGLPVEVVGTGPMWQLVFPDVEMEREFTRVLFREGFLIAPFDAQKPSYSMQPEHYERLLSVCKKAFGELAENSSWSNLGVGQWERAVASTYVLNGFPMLPGLETTRFIQEGLLPRMSTSGLVREFHVSAGADGAV